MLFCAPGAWPGPGMPRGCSPLKSLMLHGGEHLPEDKVLTLFPVEQFARVILKCFFRPLHTFVMGCFFYSRLLLSCPCSLSAPSTHVGFFFFFPPEAASPFASRWIGTHGVGGLLLSSDEGGVQAALRLLPSRLVSDG